MQLKDRFAAARKRSGKKQETLAHDAGLTRKTVSSIESGAASPTVDTLNALLGSMGLTLTEFFESKVPKKYADPAHQDLHEYLQVILESGAEQAATVASVIQMAYAALTRDDPKKEIKHRRKAGAA